MLTENEARENELSLYMGYEFDLLKAEQCTADKELAGIASVVTYEVSIMDATLNSKPLGVCGRISRGQLGKKANTTALCNVFVEMVISAFILQCLPFYFLSRQGFGRPFSPSTCESNILCVCVCALPSHLLWAPVYTVRYR